MITDTSLTDSKQAYWKLLEQESDDRVGNTVSSLCVTNGEDMAFQGQI